MAQTKAISVKWQGENGSRGSRQKMGILFERGEYKRGKGRNINGMKWRFKENCSSF